MTGAFCEQEETVKCKMGQFRTEKNNSSSYSTLTEMENNSLTWPLASDHPWCKI